MDILLTTPYTDAVKFGYFVDLFYKNEDGATGYAVFIKDIQRYGSARRALRNLGKSIKDSVDMGVKVADEVEKRYQTDKYNALSTAGLKPRYFN